ncbi:hypothetical protein SAMN05216436_11386 [bacterium A37T11]|nr:hypothetical protein SAMN05216436_11386 [bacterium A37T11]
MNFDYQHLPEGIVQLLAALGIITVLIWVFYANTVRKVIRLIAPENRFLKPDQVWLLVIPLFNIYWNFVVARRLADSLTNEFFDRKIAEEESPGKIAGIRYAIFFLLCNIPLPGIISLTFFLLAVIYFVAYWVKVYNFKLLLEEHDHFLESHNISKKG